MSLENKAKEENQSTPRNQCRKYILENGGVEVLVTKEKFDEHYHQREFQDGPWIDSFGDDGHEPYIPVRQIFGRLEDGKVVFYEF
jgi:hypothetical protein